MWTSKAASEPSECSTDHGFADESNEAGQKNTDAIDQRGNPDGPPAHRVSSSCRSANALAAARFQWRSGSAQEIEPHRLCNSSLGLDHMNPGRPAETNILHEWVGRSWQVSQDCQSDGARPREDPGRKACDEGHLGPPLAGAPKVPTTAIIQILTHGLRLRMSARCETPTRT